MSYYLWFSDSKTRIKYYFLKKILSCDVIEIYQTIFFAFPRGKNMARVWGRVLLSHDPFFHQFLYIRIVCVCVCVSFFLLCFPTKHKHWKPNSNNQKQILCLDERVNTATKSSIHRTSNNQPCYLFHCILLTFNFFTNKMI